VFREPTVLDFSFPTKHLADSCQLEDTVGPERIYEIMSILNSSSAFLITAFYKSLFLSQNGKSLIPNFN